jgi:HSP20 family protein
MPRDRVRLLDVAERAGVLTIAGERRREKEEKAKRYHRVERAFGAFQRSLTLPQGITADDVEASFDNGVLEVKVPKPQERKPQRVQIARSVEGTGTEK